MRKSERGSGGRSAKPEQHAHEGARFPNAALSQKDTATKLKLGHTAEVNAHLVAENVARADAGRELLAYPDGVATLGSDRLMFSERARTAAGGVRQRKGSRHVPCGATCGRQPVAAYPRSWRGQ